MKYIGIEPNDVKASVQKRNPIASNDVIAVFDSHLIMYIQEPGELQKPSKIEIFIITSVLFDFEVTVGKYMSSTNTISTGVASSDTDMILEAARQIFMGAMSFETLRVFHELFHRSGYDEGYKSAQHNMRMTMGFK